MKKTAPLGKEEEAALRRHSCPPEGTCDVCRLLATLDRARSEAGDARREAEAVGTALESVLENLRKAWTARSIHAPVGYGSEAMREVVSKAESALAPRRRRRVVERGTKG